ncbi:tRNA (guanosine(18)-2'-O)-methyltransferase [Salvia divinorum]|uniref:tRNA (Guanosine(18)-2'-O)-methyltransferase n=1 Tax=Salvia divinorum TaxID=28513 RepID=A0ABD1IER0_SALDI
MQSFLSIKWDNYGCCARVVPTSFILGPFIRALNDPVHHKEFGAKEIYSSWAIEASLRFLYLYASYMEDMDDDMKAYTIVLQTDLHIKLWC